ncbi:MAG: MBL fold metallo-hydrolase [Acidobacteria bacterium]|nr:MBL fold metallo-hydrolase [Acidobacteriota bacterium]
MPFPRLVAALVLIPAFCAAAAAQGGPRLSKLGEWGTGPYQDVQVVGNYAYCAALGAGMDILDVSSPAAPVKVAGVSTRNPTHGLCISGNYAYLAEDEGGLRIVNILDPLHPQVMSSLGDIWDARDVFVSGQYAYVAAWGLHVVDISNPLSPVRKAWFETGSELLDVFVAGSYAYVVQPQGFRIIDVSNPANPVQASALLTDGETSGVWVAGGLAYLADPNEYLILNVSNPYAPTEVYHEIQIDGNPKGVFVEGTTVYLADDDLSVFDASNPSTFHKIGGAATPGTARRVWVAGGKAYVADTTHGLQIYSVSNPAAPSALGGWNFSGQSHDLFLSGGKVYWAHDSGGLRIMDAADPAALVQLARYEKHNAIIPQDLDYMRGVHVAGNTAYVLTAGNTITEFLCLNVTNPAAPSLTGQTPVPAWACDTVTASGGTAVLTDDGNGMKALDVSNPAAPGIIGTYTALGTLNHACWGGAYLYVVNHDGLYALNMTNPASPTVAGHWETVDDVEGVFVLGNRAFLAIGEVGLKIVDVTNPAAMTVIGSLDTSGQAHRVFADDRYAYVADGTAGVKVIDISTPSAPFLVDANETYDARDVAVESGIVYLADGASGRLVTYEFAEKLEAWMPHVAPNYGWQTTLVIDNGGDQPCKAMIELYENGATVSSQALTVPAGRQASVPLLAGTCAHVVYSGSRVVVKEAFVSSENGIAEFEVDGATHTTLHYLLPNYDAANLSWMGLAAFNPDDTDATATFEAYDANGVLLGSGTHVIGRRNTFVRFIDAVVTGVDFRQVARIKASSSQPLCGLNISGFNTERLLFTRAQSAAPGGLLYMSHMGDDPNALANRLVFDNTGTVQVQASVRLYRSGALLRQLPVTVNGGRTVVLDLNASSSADMPDCGTVDAGGGFTFVRQSFTHKTEKGTAEFLLTGSAATQLTYNYPGYVAGRVQWMGLAVYNPSDSDITLSLTAVKNGAVVAANTVPLGARSRLAMMLEYLFPGHTFQEIERVIVSCPTANLAGINISGYGVSRLLFTPAFRTGVRAPDPGLDTFLGTIHKIYHAGFWVMYEGKTLYFDPINLPLLVSRKADVIFLTHPHPDHLVVADLAKIVKAGTVIVTPTAGLGYLSQFPNLRAVTPDGVYEAAGIPFRTVAAYNQPGAGGTHYKALGFVGYRLQLGAYSLYHAGDTDFVPEMLGLQPSVALLPVGGAPQVMTPAKAADAARALPADVVIPMHYDLAGSAFDAEELEDLLTGQVRVVIKPNEAP